MTRVLVLLPVVGHPRDSKRIDMMLSQGMTVEAAAFSRDHPVSRPPNCNVTPLGEVEDGKYLRRIGSALLALPQVIRLARRNDLIYASGQDMALIGLVAGQFHKPVVMEVGDLREIQFDTGVKGALVRSLDRLIAKKVAFIVATSEKFISRYYAPLLRRDVEHLVIENKLDSDFVAQVEVTGPPQRRRRDPTRPIVIGYFGVLRFQWALDALAEVLERNPGRFSILLAGYTAAGVDLQPLLKNDKAVRYLSTYRSPEDLPKLYRETDLSWCAYPISSGQHSGKDWVRANRFYEAGLFKKPLVVLSGTGDAAAVEELDLGLVLPSSDIVDVAQRMGAISDEDMARWTDKLHRLPPTAYAYTNEPHVLAQRMRRATAGVPAR